MDENGGGSVGDRPERFELFSGKSVMTARRRLVIIGLLVLVSAAAVAAFFWTRRDAPQPQARVQSVVEAADSSSFARATGPQPLNFPADYGPHPDYQTEWWYYLSLIHICSST